MVARCTHLAALVLVSGVLPGWGAAASAQSPLKPERRAYVELLGAGWLYSVNVEQDMTPTFGVRLGAGGVPLTRPQYVVGLLGLTWRVGDDLRAFHVGAGMGLAGAGLWENEKAVYGFGSAAFHYQSRSPGGFLRVAFTPLLVKDRVIPSLGLALGWAY